MKSTFACALAASLLMTFVALADDKVVKIGVLNDQSSLYADLGGPGSTLAAQMAVEDSGLTKKGWTIDVISATTRTSRTSASASRANGSTKTRST